MSASEFLTVNPHYLARLLANPQPAAAREDIFAEDGTKLVPKGSLLTEEHRDTLCAGRLRAPLETTLHLPGVNLAAGLISQAREQLQQHELLQLLFIRPVDRNALITILETLPLTPATSLWLATLEPERELPHALLACMLSVGLGRQLGLPGNVLSQLALSALLHDIGQLYLDTGYLSPQHTLAPGDWRHIISHPLLGCRLVMGLSGLKQPQTVAMAILQHHERQDGSGYPRQLSGDAISLPGQILAVADTVSHLLAQQATAARIDIALKIVPGEYSHALTSILCRHIRQLPSSENSPQEAELEPLHQLLHRIGLQTQQLWNLKEEEEQLSETARALLEHTMLHFNSLQRSILSAGANQTDALPGNDACIQRELLDIAREVGWRLQNLARDIALALDKLAEPERGRFLELARLLMAA